MKPNNCPALGASSALAPPVPAASGARTPTTKSRSAPRWIAGESGVAGFRVSPSVVLAYVDQHMSQFGWQFEKQFYTRDSGVTMVSEWVALVASWALAMSANATVRTNAANAATVRTERIERIITGSSSLQNEDSGSKTGGKTGTGREDGV